MYLKYTIDGPLEDLVKKVWPDATENELLRDYENVYEWVWLELKQLGIRLNISREHEWGEGTTIFPIYISAFKLDEDEFVDEVPEEVIQKLHKAMNCKIEIFQGKCNVEVEDGTPIRVLE